MVHSASTLYAKLHKHHSAMTFHCICEAVVAKINGFYFIKKKINSADFLSIHWRYQQVWKILHLLLFLKVDMYSIGVDDKFEPTSG